LDAFGEILGVGGGLNAPQTLLTIKKGTSPLDFESNELFSKFLLQQMVISKFLSDVFWKNTRCGGVFGSTRYFDILKLDILMKLGVRIFWVKSKVEFVDRFCSLHLEVGDGLKLS